MVSKAGLPSPELSTTQIPCLYVKLSDHGLPLLTFYIDRIRDCLSIREDSLMNKSPLTDG